MKKILVILLCLGLVGCLPFSRTLLQKNEEITRLQDLLKEKEDAIKEKNLKIEQLRKKLENFGVFE